MDECCPVSGVATLMSIRELQVDVACQALEPGQWLSGLLLASCS